jgi:RNA polymerase sigma-70 factor (ECF subfamily)
METSVSLLERLAGGQPRDDDWRRLIDLYEPLFRTWMAGMGVAPSEADDLAQDVLMVVFREVGAFERRGKGAFRSWLRTILLNRVRHHFRSRKYLPTATGDNEVLVRLHELEARECELSELWDREHDRHVAAALMRRVQGDFTPLTWQAFCRYVLEEVPANQVADQLGMSVNSVIVAKSRVLKRLRQELTGLVE